MRKLFYMGLESYEARYTLQLQDWNERVFNLRGVDYEVITGDELDNSKAIVTGSVLDAHGRTYYSLSQTMSLIQMMKNGELTSDDVIFYEDNRSIFYESNLGSGLSIDCLSLISSDWNDSLDT